MTVSMGSIYFRVHKQDEHLCDPWCCALISLTFWLLYEFNLFELMNFSWPKKKRKISGLQLWAIEVDMKIKPKLRWWWQCERVIVSSNVYRGFDVADRRWKEIFLTTVSSLFLIICLHIAQFHRECLTLPFHNPLNDQSIDRRSCQSCFVCWKTKWNF